jgi:hypothetical protein
MDIAKRLRLEFHNSGKTIIKIGNKEKILYFRGIW